MIDGRCCFQHSSSAAEIRLCFGDANKLRFKPDDRHRARRPPGDLYRIASPIILAEDLLVSKTPAAYFLSTATEDDGVKLSLQEDSSDIGPQPPLQDEPP